MGHEVFKLMGTIAISNGQANDAIDETTSKAASAKSKLGNAFGKIGSFALSAAKVVGTAAVAATGAVATGIAAMTKSAVDNYAQYEQLVGGVETLFKDSADKVKEYADQAYKTAGMSANTYMETVTSFSASLLQSLDGDTAKATESANQAIIDMSDNANKMGSDIGMIMNAYQGFAKQNYTMLDNLKLGYGGTKTEMERLLKDAQKLSGVKYDISSYDDIIQAIHVIQTDMGITGTTAKEASETIQGSIGQLKGAWENFMTGMADPNQDFDALMNNLVDSVVAVADNLVPRITATLPRIIQGVSQVVQNLAAYVPEIVSTLVPAIITTVQSLISELSTKFPELLAALFPEMGAEFHEGIASVFSTLPEVFNTVVTTMQSMFPVILQVVQDVFPPVLACVQALLPVIIELVSTALPQAFAIIQRLVPPLMQIVNKVLPPVVKLLTPILDLIGPLLDLIMPLLDVVLALLEPVMTLISAVLPAITDLASLMVDALLPVIQQLCDIWQGYLVPLIQMLVDLLLPIILEAIANLMTAFEGVLKFISGLYNVIEGVFNLILSLFTGDWEGVGEAIMQILNGVLNMVVGLLQAAFFSIINMVVKYWDDIVLFFTEGIPTFIANAVTWLQEILPKLAEFFAGLPGKLAEWFVATIQKVVEWRTQLREKGIEVIKSLIEGILKKAKDIPDKVKEIGKNIVDGVWKGIKDAKEKFMENISGFFTGIVDGAKEVLDIHSPSKKFEWIGEMCVSGFDKGAEELEDGTAFEDAAFSSIPATVESVGASNGIDYDRMTQCFIKALQTVAPDLRANVSVEGDAKGMFKVMQKEASVYKKSTGMGAFA